MIRYPGAEGSAAQRENWRNTNTNTAVQSNKRVPGGVEAFYSLLVVSPVDGAVVLAGPTSTAHGALHVGWDHVPDGLPHQCVVCSGGCDWSCVCVGGGTTFKYNYN